MTVNLERDFSGDARMGIDIRGRGPLDPFGRRAAKIILYLLDGDVEEETRIALNEGQARILLARLGDFLR